MSIANDPIRMDALGRPISPALSRDHWVAEPTSVEAIGGDPNGDGQYSEFADAMSHAQRIRYAMAVTQGKTLDARPLTTQTADPDGVIWFFVPAEGELTRDTTQQPELLLVYADTDSGRYLSINGRASLVVDVERAKHLWTSIDETFFPGGPADPSLRLLRVDVSRVELWEPKGTRLGKFLKMAAAAMGKPVSTSELGHHEVLESPRN